MSTTTIAKAALAEVKDALKGNDSAAISAASEKLNQAWQAVSEVLYKAAADKAKASGAGATGAGTESASGGGAGPGASDKDQGPIIDAEVVDEKK